MVRTIIKLPRTTKTILMQSTGIFKEGEVVVTTDSNELYRIDAKDKKVALTSSSTSSTGDLDGGGANSVYTPMQYLDCGKA